jgi:hypothetical protein
LRPSGKRDLGAESVVVVVVMADIFEAIALMSIWGYFLLPRVSL